MRVDLSCFKFLDETRYVAVVRAIANIARFRFRPGVISVCGLSLLLVLALFRGLFSGLFGFSPSAKINTLNFCENQPRQMWLPL